jgi:DNA-binding MarR family transcriptional regulator
MRKRKPALVPPSFIRRRHEEILSKGQLLALETLFALRASTHNIDTALTRWMGDDAITPGRLQILSVLWANEIAIPQSEIAKALKVTRATVSELVESLRKEGHVRLLTTERDRRSVLVTLTPSGRGFTERIIKENSKRLRDALGELSDTDLRRLIALLQKLPA